jgi:aldehyde:ferredoxin oxidoreductase
MNILRVNMTNATIVIENVPQKYLGLGGRGLTSTIINSEVPPTCDPLGPDNKLIFAPGLLAGTMVVNSGRLSVGAKSPLTKGIKESNAGGTVGNALGRKNIAAIVVEGKAKEGEYYVLKIDENGDATLNLAPDYIGMRTYALVENLIANYGNDNSMLYIGPAGEWKLNSASIQSSDADGRPCRAAGRGGLGAVMGSKGLKAIVVNRSGRCVDALSDPSEFNKAAKKFVKAIQSNAFCSQVLPAMGTASLTSMVNEFGGFSSRNATQGVMENHIQISGEKLSELVNERGGKVGHRGCSQCIIRCSNEFVDSRGKYITGSLEYETIWAMGGMTDIDDLYTIATLDFLADDIGLDTMNTGVEISVAMDAGFRKFGDSKAAIEIMEEIAKGIELGIIFGNGPQAVGNYLNHHRVPVVKGQSIAAYDPRAMPANGVTYATSPMGADHTAGNLVGRYLAGELINSYATGLFEASKNAQIFVAYLDCTGLCLFSGGALASPDAAEAIIKMINIKCGTKFKSEDTIRLGIKVLKTEIEFNSKAGLTKKDDRLPRFFYDEPLPPNNKTFIISDKYLENIHNYT